MPELTSSHSRTQCFLFLADKNWCSSCASFSPFFFSSPSVFFAFNSLLPSPPSFPFSLLLLGRTGFVPVLPSFHWARLSDMALSGCVYPPPHFSLIPPPSCPHCSPLTQGGGGGTGRFFSFSLLSLFMYCMSLRLTWETAYGFKKKDMREQDGEVACPQNLAQRHTTQAVTCERLMIYLHRQRKCGVGNKQTQKMVFMECKHQLGISALFTIFIFCCVL